MDYAALIAYDPATGSFTWKHRSDAHFKSARAANAWNGRFPGKNAGSLHWHGERRHAVLLTIGSRRCYAHRIAWEIHNGPIPAGMLIDHINGNPFDNRLCNLRLATYAQNGWNSKAKCYNTSGFKGVTWSKAQNRWRAQIKVNRKGYLIGSYRTREEAYAAYVEAAPRYHGEFAKTS